MLTTQERAQSAKTNAASRIVAEIQDKERLIAQLEGQIVAKDGELQKIEDEKRDLDAEQNSGQVAIRKIEQERNPADIAAEDALDTIVRLENTLKAVQRRNQLSSKENATMKLALKDRKKELLKVNGAVQDMKDITGYSADKPSRASPAELMRDIEEMEGIAARMENEHKTSQVIIRKKSQVIDTMQREIALKKETEEQLYLTFNDIRVKDKEIQDTIKLLEAMKVDDKRRDLALRAAEDSRDNVAIESLQMDKAYLAEQVAKHQDDRRKLDRVSKAQLYRLKDLNARFDIVSAALRDLKIEQEVNAKSSHAVVPAGNPDRDPFDDDQVMPADERIPVELYELLNRDLEAMRTSISHKDIIALEKETTVRSLADKVEEENASYKESTSAQVSVFQNKVDEMEQLKGMLQQQHHSYRVQIDQLLKQNLQLKARISDHKKKREEAMQ